LRIKVGNLAVDKHQPDIEKHSYPLFFIHGAGGTSKYLKNYLLFFARAGWTSYAINLRGHHPSDYEPALAQTTLEDYIADVEIVLTALGVENCALIGHSMGGLIAQKVAMRFKQVQALVAIASAPPLGFTLEMRENLPYSEALMNSMWGLINMQPVKLTYSLAEKTVLNNIEEKKRKDIFSLFVAESLVVGYQIAHGVFVDPEKITCPKLVIGCQRDLVASEAMERGLAGFLKADYISYRHFAHLPMIEKGWQKSARDISHWLQNNIQEQKTYNGKEPQ